jgi:hypothetical protein
MSTKSKAKKKNDFDDDDLDEEEEDDNAPPRKRKKIDKASFIDDAAEESDDGAERKDDDDEEEEEDDGDNNDYVRDGFVVDEDVDDDDDDDIKKKKSGDLEDSDEDEDDEDDDIVRPKKTTRLKKVRKIRDRLDEDDLMLIQEAQGLDPAALAAAAAQRRADDAAAAAAMRRQERVVAHDEAELRNRLFDDDDDDDEVAAARPKDKATSRPPESQRQQVAVERYDEDGMDDFIDDDIGDQGDIMASDRRGAYQDDDVEGREVTEAQMNEASEIFGTDYLDFMTQGDREDEEEADLIGRRDRGLGIDDDEELSEEDDDDDLFGEDDDEDDAGDRTTSQQRKEALRLKREKRKLARAERRRQALQKRNERRKAQLRRVFEPVQLVENFCTDRDDEIRDLDAPERFFDWRVPYHGTAQDVGALEAALPDAERELATWMMHRIPDIATEYRAAGSSGDDEQAVIYEREQILRSIAHALRFMHVEKMEPAFIKRYRSDYVTSEAVRNNLYAIQDEEGEWDHMLTARSKVQGLITTVARPAEGDTDADAELSHIENLQNQLKEAQQILEAAVEQETTLQAEIETLEADDGDDDDELFGDDDDEVRWFHCR